MPKILRIRNRLWSRRVAAYRLDESPQAGEESRTSPRGAESGRTLMMVYFKGGRLLAAAALTALGAAGGAMLMSSANGADSASSRLQQVADRQAIEQLLTGDYPR